MKPKQFLKLFILCAVLQLPVTLLRYFNVLDLPTCLAIMAGTCFVIYVFYTTVNDERRKALSNELRLTNYELEETKRVLTENTRILNSISERKSEYLRELNKVRGILFNNCENEHFETDTNCIKRNVYKKS